MGYKYRDTKAISIDPVTETGNIVTFENPDDVIGITSLIADIEPIQDGTPWVSPDNIAPYLLRQSPQYGNEYNNEFDTLIGGSIAWNQLVKNGNFADTSEWSPAGASISVSNNIGTIVSNANYGRMYQMVSATLNHKYLFCGAIKSSSASVNARIRWADSDTANPIIDEITNSTDWVHISKIVLASRDTTNNLAIGSHLGAGTIYAKEIYIIDLTAFNSDIADYVYSLEQSTAGSGVAWLKEHFPKLFDEYHAYEPGSLVSVKTSEHRTTGKNLLDENYFSDTSYFDINADHSVDCLQSDNRAWSAVPATQKFLAGTYVFSRGTTIGRSTIRTSINDYATDFTTIFDDSSSVTFTLPQDCYLKIKASYSGSYPVTAYPMIRFADVSDATFEPYTEHSYPLGNDDLRGIFKLSNGNLYADGDVKTSDGQIQRKYSIVDLGTLTWNYTSTYQGFYATLSNPAYHFNGICSEYPFVGTFQNVQDKQCGYIFDTQVFIKDSNYSTASAFKTAMSGVYLVYELATPTTQTADPFESPQIVDPNGTEEYIDTRDVPVPVGHRTVYKNIAPISGYSEINIYVSPTEDAEDATVYPVDLNGTRYGKQMNVTTGQLEVCPYYASYNGETLTGEWISDRDVYAPGTTPSIGAQVVNIGGTLTTEQLLPTDIKTLVGTNNVWSDSGDITLTYAVDPSLYITLPKEAVSMDGRYLERMIDGYTTLYVKGRESLGIELNTYSVGTADGERVKGSRYPSRTLTIGFQLLCEDEVEFRAKFNQLNNLLSIGRADFIFADEPTMFFTGTPVMDASIEPGRNNVTGEWKLYCDYPFKRSVEPTVLASTDSGVLVGDHEATFVFDYKGVMPAKPILRCEFDSTKNGGDYSEDGDCGFVAFLNQDESIIQLGNPEIIDLDSINKSATLINSEFSSLANWTVDGMTAGNIVDPYWNNGEGQTQSYAKGIGTLSRTTTGAIDFDFSIVHRLCVNASSQTGAFKVDLTNDGDTIVGFAIEKTGNGTSATVSYIVNGIIVGTDNIDISYNNANFGFCSRTEYFVVTDINGKETILTKDNYYRRKFGFYDDFFGFGGFRHGSQIRKVRREYDYSQSNLNSRISRNGNAVTFQIGNLAKRTFKNNDIENVPCYDVKFETTGNFDTNAIRSCSFIRKTGVAFAKIPNVFTAGDIVEADCNSANVFMYRNGSLVGHLEPQYGALGNNWEDFNIKVGHNIIRAVWSEWSNPAYKPVIKIIFNEVYI